MEDTDRAPKKSQKSVHVRETESQMAMHEERDRENEAEKEAKRRQSLRHFSLVDADPEAQRKHHELIQRLLSEIDLEDTKQKYRSVPVEYRMNEKTFSYDCAMAGKQVMRRLEGLMGTDVVNLNDPTYIENLQQRLQEEYEMCLVRREQALANNEKQRLRKLYLEGVIPRPPGETELYEKKRSGKKDKDKLKINKQEGPDAESGIWPRTPGVKAKESQQEAQGQMCQSQFAHNIPMMPEDGSHFRRSSRPMSVEGKKDRVEDMPEVTDWYQKNDRPMPRFYDDDGRPLPVRYEAPVVAELRQEETVQGLYSVANKIIP